MSKPFIIVLASQSKLKYRAVKEAFTGYATTRGKDLLIKTYSMSELNLPEQPVNSGRACAEGRALYLQGRLDGFEESFDLIIAIENGIETEYDPGLSSEVHDVAFVCIIDSNSRKLEGRSIPIPFDIKYFDQARVNTSEDYAFLPGNYHGKKYSGYSGYAETIGQQIEKEYRNVAQKNMMLTSFITSDDWMRHPDFGGFSRVDQIQGPLSRLRDKVELNELYDALIFKPDFPREGVLFKGMDRILSNPAQLNVLKRLIYKFVSSHFNIKGLKVAGISSRGYIYGMLLSSELLPQGGGFIKVAKKGKLPGKTISISYEKEYGPDTLEVLEEVIQPGDRVLVIDDLVATGGSLAAAVELVHRAGGIPVGCLVMLQVDSMLAEASKKIQDLSSQIGTEVPLYVLMDRVDAWTA